MQKNKEDSSSNKLVRVGAESERNSLLNYNENMDPKSTLPRHLQGMNYEEDLWRRIQDNPLANPELYGNRILSNPKVREVIRQIMSAGNEREKEVLLHNQARVFSEIFKRFISSFRQFMNTPIIFNSWFDDENNDDMSNKHDDSQKQNNENEPSKSDSDILKKIIKPFLTPKIVTTILLISIGAFAGYSQIQIVNLNDSVASYEQAARASRETRNLLSEQMKVIQEEKEKSHEEISKHLNKIALLEKEKRDLKNKNIDQSQIIEAQEIKLNDLNEQLGNNTGRDSFRIRRLQEKNQEVESQLLQLKTALAKKENEISSLTEKILLADSNAGDFQKIADARTKQIDTLIEENRDFAIKIGVLRDKAVLLDFAETFIDNIRAQVGDYYDPNEKEIIAYLIRYDAAKASIFVE